MKKFLSILAIVTLLTSTSVMAAPGGPGGHGGPGGPGGPRGGHVARAGGPEHMGGPRHNPPPRVHRRSHHGVALYTGLGARHCYWGSPYCDYRVGWYDDCYYYPPEPYYIRYPHRPLGWGGGIFINF